MPPAAPLKRRTAALIYELLLAAAVGCVAAIPAGLAALLLNPVLPQLSSIAVSLILLAAWWLYFRLNWQKKGRTLPMKVWHIGLTDRHGRPPAMVQLRLRFVWACILWLFIPMLAYGVLQRWGQIPPKTAFGAALIWWLLPWGFALLNPDRQFLHDFLAGTRLTDTRPRKRNTP
ncbi:RDD family protein [Neisseria leonii]|uniref:RDD family protein n=1 Tax=Neisseria leonii TaxID=2995413 RepID=UPI00237A7E08|nr:RDD family protein [Neisseria sp. 3986]MDD9326050.1 RDD family protein [Neisseria sp. 3986]